MIKELVLKYALKNAVDYNGKANVSAVIAKVIQEQPILKANIKEVGKLTSSTVKKINKLSLEEQKLQLAKFKFKAKEKAKVGLKSLENVKGGVVMRFAPNPNGALSLGQSRQALLNWFYVKKYNGEYVLRYDDTDAKIKFPIKKAYDWILNDLKWLGIKPNIIIKQSSRLKIYYKYAEQLIKKNGAYICVCNKDKWKKTLRQGCKCRNLKVNEQLKRWKLMFTKYKEGKAVYRIKTNLEDKNPALIDWPCFRIVDKSKHPLQKKVKVWPLLNFASAIDDHLLKLTHILRGIDLRISDDRQKALYAYFNWEYPETIYTGKLFVKGIKSTSEARKLIESKKLLGWDDPRLGTIAALRKRGFLASSIKKLIKELSLTKADSNVSFSKLVSINKEVIDKEANRYFAIFNPKKINIKNAPSLTTKVPLHPDFPKRGFRTFKTKNKFYLQDKLDKNKIYRLIHLFNFKNSKFIDKEYDVIMNAKLIHWLPDSKDLVKIEVLMDDGKVIKGLAEPSLKKLKVNDVIQFVRFGFCRLNKKNKKLEFVYSHN